jgi:cell division protein FtsL
MRRLDWALFAILIVCAVALVNTQHRARRLFVDLEREKTVGDQLAADLRRLQAERASLVAANRVERSALTLHMHPVDSKSTARLGVPQSIASAHPTPVAHKKAAAATPSKKIHLAKGGAK